ncbi:hypothetical protein EDB92DRAFT_1947423 [Lactarius akahatsu]|uniref:Fungal lipase-type domain-containing protein n=1 Tax=Lactarius akahatsu TaxID=416441 RepID=A0AAD4LFW1_9AGAM|nr:hypothetical protein EDB92DRAFT_1947423 [Lactarius akahatsu]
MGVDIHPRHSSSAVTQLVDSVALVWWASRIVRVDDVFLAPSSAESQDMISPQRDASSSCASKLTLTSTSTAQTCGSARVPLKMALLIMLSWLTIVVASADLAPAAAFKRQSISPLSPDQISSHAALTHFVPAVFCDALLVLSWSCGGKIPLSIDSGVEGTEIQYWFVGYDPDHITVIVVHQGTNVTHMVASTKRSPASPYLKVTLDSDLFPSVPSSIKVHSRFSKDQARTTPMVLSAVQDVTSKYNATSVPTVGHSRGAALSLLDSVHLRLQLPADISVKAVLFGLPRVGNQDWANFVDTHIHIDDTDAWDACPGQDNPSKMCVIGAVPSLFHSNR